MNEYKACSQCRHVKPLRYFYRDKGALDGRKSYCKECDKIKYDETRNRVRQSPEGRSTRSVWNRTRNITESKRLREARHVKAYREKYPEKEAAKRIVTLAIKRGSLLRPTSCELCGKNPGSGRDGRPLIHAHHDDYAIPLSVRWLCIMCHASHHQALTATPTPSAPTPERSEQEP